jgi:hydroxymethylglutaryl-CoA lyase
VASANGAERAIADTIGTATPGRVTDLVGRVRPEIGDTPLGAHFHNTRGSGMTCRARCYGSVIGSGSGRPSKP